METTVGHGWAELKDDNSLQGKICPTMAREQLHRTSRNYSFNSLLDA